MQSALGLKPEPLHWDNYTSVAHVLYKWTCILGLQVVQQKHLCVISLHAQTQIISSLPLQKFQADLKMARVITHIHFIILLISFLHLHLQNSHFSFFVNTPCNHGAKVELTLTNIINNKKV